MTLVGIRRRGGGFSGGPIAPMDPERLVPSAAPAMADDPIHQHITACTALTDAETKSLTARILDECWPGGADRSEPGALGWVRRWRPGTSEAALPTCSCPHGRCIVCN